MQANGYILLRMPCKRYATVLTQKYLNLDTLERMKVHLNAALYSSNTKLYLYLGDGALYIGKLKFITACKYFFFKIQFWFFLNFRLKYFNPERGMKF